jgi:hypothetical protein
VYVFKINIKKYENVSALEYFLKSPTYLLIKENMEKKKYQITINPTPLNSKPLKSDNSIGIIYNNLNLVTGMRSQQLYSNPMVIPGLVVFLMAQY